MLKNTYLEFVTNGSGAVTVIDGHSISGLLHSIELFATDLLVGADFVISVTDTGSAVDKTILTLTDAGNVNEEHFPRELEHSNLGVELLTYTQPIIVGKIKVVVAQGGDTKVGKIIVNYYNP